MLFIVWTKNFQGEKGEKLKWTIPALKKSYKSLLIVLLLVAITVGGLFMFSMLGKSQEERRNREYEVSLVNALKNSYQGIKEIKIMDPYYNDKPRFVVLWYFSTVQW